MNRRGWVAAAAILIALGAVFVIARNFSPVPQVERVVRFRMETVTASDPDDVHDAGNFAVSPDGERIAFVAAGPNGTRILWLRALDSLEPFALRQTEDASAPFWSPDSRHIGFFAQGKLKAIDTTGGGAQVICDAPTGRSGTWSREGVILFGNPLIYRVSATGGSPSPVTQMDRSRQAVSHEWPFFLPDSRHFIFSVTGTSPQHEGVYLSSLESGTVRPLLSGRLIAMYAEGNLHFVRDGALLIQPFNDQRLEITGEPHSMPFADRVEQFSVSGNGVLAYRASVDSSARFTWFDRSGRSVGDYDIEGEFGAFSLSPDGRRIVFERNDPQTRTSDLWMLDTRRGVTSRLTFDPANDRFPLWSPEGNRIAFIKSRVSEAGIYLKQADAGGADEIVIKSERLLSLDSWSPDGRFILYSAAGDKVQSELRLVSLGKDETPRFGEPLFNIRQGRFSPDGRWIAYVSDETGKDEVYIRAFPGGGKWQVSPGGGDDPRWSIDGRELFYVSTRRLMAVPVRSASGSTIELGVPQAMFRIYGDFYDPSDARSKVLILARTYMARPTPIDIVVGWRTALRRSR